MSRMSGLKGRRSKVRALATQDNSPERSSVGSSLASLSPSELDIANMNIINGTTRQDGIKRGTICKGNQITSKGKRKQVCLVITVVALPLIILLGMTANTFGITLRGYLKAFGIRKVLRFSTELGDLIHNLQKERDVSALYLSSDLAEAKKRLISSYIDTDNVLEKLTYWPSIQDKDYPEYHSRENYQIYLNRHRYQLDTLNQTVTEELLFYTTGIDVILVWLYASITEARSGTVWRSLVAFLEITESKKYMGIERALGAIYYTNGEFPSMMDYLWFSESQDIANASFRSARRFSGAAASIYDDLVAKNNTIVGTLEDMRRDIRLNEQYDRQGSFNKAKYWMATVTSYLQILMKTQEAVVSSIFVELDEREREDIHKMIIIAVVFSGVLLMCPVIVHGVISLANEMQSYSITLDECMEALEKAKKRTDRLMYQMLPKSVAEQLKRNGRVDAETYSDVTIFFSDIVGFTELSAQCSPAQVVDMLNSLDGLFDSCIMKYDVYKVERIGNAYMVASGLPERNGKNHAAEICRMALDLSDRIHGLTLPHLPGKRLKLRIGIHTGPIIAGVAGFKMPRYCLYGNTVTIASRMECLGIPDHIHISERTYDTLQELGGFASKQRLDDAAKRDADLVTALKGNIQTYWLLGYEGQHQIRTAPTETQIMACTENMSNSNPTPMTANLAQLSKPNSLLDKQVQPAESIEEQD